MPYVLIQSQPPTFFMVKPFSARIEVTFVAGVDDLEFEAPRSGFLRSVGETRPCRISSQKPHNFNPTWALGRLSDEARWR